MQTILTPDTLPSERRFQVSTHVRPAPALTMARAMHAREAGWPLPSGPELPASPQADGRPRDISARFGAKLRSLRRERNLTQLRMASDFGIDRSFISDVERGKKSISLPMLEVIALGMKLSLSELLRDI